MPSRSPLSRRTPWMLLRFPEIAAAVLAGALILALPTSSSPVFTASAGAAALAAEVEEVGAVGAGFTLIDYTRLAGPGGSGEAELVERDDAMLAATRRLEGLAPRILGILAETPSIGGSDVRLLSRTGAASEVAIVEGDASGGVLVPLSVARAEDVEPGDQVTLSEPPRSASVTVGGIYRDLALQPLSPYWTSYAEYVVPPSADAEPPPPFLLMDEPAMVAVTDALPALVQTRWELPVDLTGTTLAEAAELRRALARVARQFNDITPDGDEIFTSPNIATELPNVVDDAQETVAALGGSVDALSLGGRVVALVVVAAAGVYGVQRRRVEITLLLARGVPPWLLGVRAAAEAALPTMLGAAAGWAAGIGLVQLLGPAGVIDPGAARAGAVAVAWSAALALVLLGAAVAVACRNQAPGASTRMKTAAARLPWEAIVLTLAAASYYELGFRGSGPLAGEAGAPDVDPLVFLFPLLFVAGASGVVARGLRAAFPWVRRLGSRWRPAPFMASRRVAGASRTGLLFVTAASVGIGILAYAAVLVSSVQATIGAKARVFSGSEVSVALGTAAQVPDDIGFPATRVVRLNQLAGQDGPVDVLGVDPSTFSEAAFWEPAFAGESLEELLGALDGGAGESVRAIAVGDVADPLTVSGTGYHLVLDPVAEARAFPGMYVDRPLLVVETAALEEAFAAQDQPLPGLHTTRELWVDGPPDEVVAALDEAGVGVARTVSAAQTERSPAYLSLSWTFGYLEALGVMAGTLALVGLVLYAQARARSRQLSYALTLRMGLSRRAHRLSVAGELAALLAAAFVTGTALAWIAARLVYDDLDPLPQFAPGPILSVPIALLAAVAGVLAAAAWLGAARLQRGADRVSVAEVMRLAD
ncbi:MAG TPA: FtsX-like permease family protein [Actinomycetota bacterium]|nr:FtsX-like permease family protein [Actinomycetota bacterium]